jgi:ubiquitin carboxyl-terminal hydrolase 4/11/15
MENAVTAFFSKSATVDEFTTEMCKRLGLDAEKVRVWDFHNGSRLKVLDDGTRTLEAAHILENQKMLLEEQNADGSWPEVKSQRSSYSYGSGYGSGYGYGYGSREPGEPGKVGLANLGNTCFMNSTLQCMSNTVPISEHFISGRYTSEINKENPLGTGGKLVERFGKLIKEMWSGEVSVAEPREFKGTLERYVTTPRSTTPRLLKYFYDMICRFAPQFSGYQQHDSQELLAFLLDGLHEDLNRIKNKPYVPDVEAEGKTDAEVAALTWEGYRSRNDSVIVDMCQGLFKSRVTCPVCSKVSIKFDPFMYLPLPLPTKSTRPQTLTFFFADGANKPLKLTLNPNKSASVWKLFIPVQYVILVRALTVFSFKIPDLKKQIAAVVNVPATSMVVTEVWQGKFHREITDKEGVDTIADNDKIYVYEILTPDNAPELFKQEQEPKSDGEDGSDDMDEDIPQPIVHCPISIKVKMTTRYGHSSYVTFGPPMIISIPSETTYDELYWKCVAYLKRGLKQTPPPLSTEEYPSQASEEPPAAGSEPAAGDGSDQSDSDDDKEERVRDNPPRYNGIFDVVLVDELSFRSTEVAFPREGTFTIKNRQGIHLYTSEKFSETWLDEKALEKPEVHQSADPTNRDKSQENTRSSIMLEDCIDLFTSEETLGPNDMAYCTGCKEHRQSNKKFDLWSLPPILVVMLKRFSFRNRYARDKLDMYVDFPLEGLDLSQYMLGPSEPGKEPIYDCYAISNHYGGLGGGHYTAFAINRNDQKWYSFDDRSVSKVSNPESVKTSAAYVLFYRRRDMNQFSQPLATATPSATANTSASAGNTSSANAGTSNDDSEDMDTSDDDNVPGAGVAIGAGQHDVLMHDAEDVPPRRGSAPLAGAGQEDDGSEEMNE